MRFKATTYTLTAVLVMAALLLVYFLFRNMESFTGFRKHYIIGVIANSVELTPEDMQIAKIIINKKVKLLNKEGGINGRKLKVIYLDDKGSPEILQQQIKETMTDEDLIGYVGCWSSTRSKAASELVGPARVPFIGGYALTPLFEQYPSMFTAELGIKEVSAVFKQFLQTKFKRAAFIGKPDDLYTVSFVSQMHALSVEDPSFKVVMEKWYLSDYQFTDAEIEAIARELTHEADLLVLSFESAISTAMIQSLRDAGVTLPIFTALGDLSLVVSQDRDHRLGELYDIHVIGIPGTLNLRLQEIIISLESELENIDKLKFQMAFGWPLADAIGIIAESANSKENQEAPTIREKVIAGLENYIGGKYIYRGWYTDWYFTNERAVAGDALLAWKPEELPHHILAPYQYTLEKDSLKQIPVFNTHIDMVKINRVNDADGSFFATFYIELATISPFSIDQIDFTNSARNEINHEPLLDIKLLRETIVAGKPSVYSNLYKVSGKFFFEPDFKNYPFDEQKFTISFQPSSALYPFLIQPSRRELRDTIFEATAWAYKDQYVGYDQDIISYMNTFSNTQQTLPFYKFSYTYVMKRVKVDFFLKTLTPLLIIMVITYLSVYIPLHRLETLEAIQVTSLLAAIALYFSAHKPATEYATTSDKIFIFTYLMITSLIGTSILRYVERKMDRAENRLARIYQVYVYPIIVILMMIFILF